MKITLKEIAARVGVAESTVSRVLSKEPTLSISDEKRRLIIETAEELNYVRVGRRPTPVRGRAAGGSVALIHALTTDEELSRAFYVGVRKGIEAAALEHGTTVLRLTPDELLALEPPRRPGGCIVIGAVPAEMLAGVLALGLPMVFADQPAPDTRHDSVVTDIDQAMMRLLDRLRDRGLKRIACLDLVEASASRALRGRGHIFQRWCEGEGRFDADYLVMGRRPDTHGRALTQKLLDGLDAAGKPLPDALVATTDTAAAEAYQTLAARGLRIPQDIAVVGTNDSSIAQLLVPPLSTIEIPAGDIGRTALELLLERLAGRQVTKTVTLHTTFLERGSIGAQAVAEVAAPPG